MRKYHRPRPKGNPPDPLAALVAARLQAEAGVVARMLAHPYLGVNRAVGMGITASDFVDPDLRLVFHSAVVHDEASLLGDYPGGDRERILVLAKQAIRAAGDWHHRTPEVLADVATKCCRYSHQNLDDAVAKLRRLANRLDTATRLAKARAA